MGTFVAFLDVSLVITGTAAGAIAHAHGLNAVYLAGAGTVFLSVLVAAYLLVKPPVTLPVLVAAPP